MRDIKNIQVSESIRKGWLIYTTSLYDNFMRIMSYLLCLILITVAIILLDYTKQSPSVNDRGFAILYSIFIVPVFYVLWRLITEKRLLKINTPYTKEENKQRLLQFATKKGFEILRQSGGSLLLNDFFHESGPPTTYSIVLIPLDNKVLFTIITERPRIAIPALTSHLFLKRDLKKFFNS